MPTLAFILERTGPYQEITNYQMPSVAMLTENYGFSHEQVQEWLEEGKEAQREYISKLEADPEWMRTAAKLGAFPGISRKAPLTFESESQRREWAGRKAKEGGWL